MDKSLKMFPNHLYAMLLIIFLSNSIIMQAIAQALCLSQFALANEACSFVQPTSPNENKRIIKLQPSHDDHQHRHRGHHHHHHEHHGDDPKDSACCRRLMGIDNACVCQIIARLPKFITKPKHVVKLSPSKGCEVSFECAGI